ncbi:hypothetical protein [Rhodobacteraceae phage LS06-2018-MD07]|jgi:hypothetical protein|nr:hypothetical protein [Rhodobacteraceae phage LS06-2018-MD07]
MAEPTGETLLGAEQAAPEPQSTPDAGVVDAGVTTTDGANPEPDGQEQPKVPGWIAGLTDQLKSDEYFHQFQKVSGLAEEHIRLREELDRAIVKPGDEATEEELQAYYQALGRPENVEGYEFADKVGDHQVPDNFRQDFAKMAFESGLPKDVAEKFYQAQIQSYLEIQETAANEYRTSVQDGEKQLKKEWTGQNYAANLKIADQAYKEFASKEVRDILNSTGIGNHPAIVKLFHTIGSKISSDSAIQSAGPAKPKAAYVVDYKTK